MTNPIPNRATGEIDVAEGPPEDPGYEYMTQDEIDDILLADAAHKSAIAADSPEQT